MYFPCAEVINETISPNHENMLHNFSICCPEVHNHSGDNTLSRRGKRDLFEPNWQVLEHSKVSNV